MEKQTKVAITEPSALEAIERAQIDMQIATARKYPRALSEVKNRMLGFATLDEETAAACFYTLPRDGKTIQGPSVRLAEIAVASYQNIRAGARVIANDGKNITAQGVCHDLENNVAVSVEVKRRITSKMGRTFSDDMQTVTGNAACAAAFRNAVFKVVPGALIKPVYEQAMKVAQGDATTLGQRRDKALEAFQKMGIQPEQILERLERDAVEDITLKDLQTLIGLHTAIKDGDTSLDESFPPTKRSPLFKLGEDEEAEADAGLAPKGKGAKK
tara:strand:- start:94 stop:909 length:816 start_codon:yes stop_codon:yes gene_type:complete